MTTLLLMSIVLLQVCQVIRLEILLKSNLANSRVDRMSNFAGMHSNYRRDILRGHSGGTSSSTPTTSTAPTGDSFSACLMFMDDNAHLIEWLAYHYHMLPLRRLIVAVDPRSKTHPTEILQRWRGRIDSTEWNELDFMPPTLMDAHQKPDLTPDELTKLFRRRQEEFYTRCMARLKAEGKTWTALVDTDEYIVPNSHSKKHYAYLQEKEKSPGSTILNLLQAQAYKEPAVENLNAMAEDLPHEVIVRQQETNVANQIQETPCFPMARLTFGVKESTPAQVQSQIPWGFDGLKFQTLRWRWHGGRTSKKINKISKALMDVSRVDSNLFVATEQVMVHLPIQEYCQGIDDLWLLNGQSLLVVHHYGGTWEQWSHREDTRGKRTREAYYRMQYDKQSDDSIRPWLKRFVQDVGWWTARNLLHRVGEIQ
jgi:Glycosyltransferase family 92